MGPLRGPALQSNSSHKAEAAVRPLRLQLPDRHSLQSAAPRCRRAMATTPRPLPPVHA
eukprot:NODE_2266_length_965_cov_372.256044.p5 GENE.NODE_2266_length_965_cov_372.256044~~NODE_2266_length_965_cov_372.256044.p5  ORF type:complete len:58 (+),score=1.02 NODE_2266_length_965_cov_372.256044:456-629(+)